MQAVVSALSYLRCNSSQLKEYSFNTDTKHNKDSFCEQADWKRHVKICVLKKKTKKSLTKSSLVLWLACSLTRFEEFCPRTHRHPRLTGASRESYSTLSFFTNNLHISVRTNIPVKKKGTEMKEYSMHYFFLPSAPRLTVGGGGTDHLTTICPTSAFRDTSIHSPINVISWI